MTSITGSTIGELLRGWRQRRRYSQLELSLAADVSTRHLSFLETGRSRPSRDMVLRLAEVLDVPLRERNTLLVAAGFAPAYAQHDLEAVALAPVRAALDRVLAAHEPYPALVVDRWWQLVAANASVGLLLDGVADHLLQPPANVVRIALHPEGLAPRLRNLGAVRAHTLLRLRRLVEATGDPRTAALLTEVEGWGPSSPADAHPVDAVAVPLRVTAPGGDLAFISTIARFEFALDVTVADLSIEAFYPADEATRRRLLDG